LDWTTAYGLHPERALRWILLLGAVLTPVYMFAMLRPTAANGVVQVFPADRLEGTAGDPAAKSARSYPTHCPNWHACAQKSAHVTRPSGAPSERMSFKLIKRKTRARPAIHIILRIS